MTIARVSHASHDVLRHLDSVATVMPRIDRRPMREAPLPESWEQALDQLAGLRRAVVHRTQVAQATGIVAERC